jgi:hypothetical protein
MNLSDIPVQLLIEIIVASLLTAALPGLACLGAYARDIPEEEKQDFVGSHWKDILMFFVLLFSVASALLLWLAPFDTVALQSAEPTATRTQSLLPTITLVPPVCGPTCTPTNTPTPTYTPTPTPTPTDTSTPTPTPSDTPTPTPTDTPTPTPTDTPTPAPTDTPTPTSTDTPTPTVTPTSTPTPIPPCFGRSEGFYFVQPVNSAEFTRGVSVEVILKLKPGMYPQYQEFEIKYNKDDREIGNWVMISDRRAICEDDAMSCSKNSITVSADISTTPLSPGVYWLLPNLIEPDGNHLPPEAMLGCAVKIIVRD